ncbi:MAG: hypothetical protein QM736_04705 [Vicinamibacterales bacterium]
MLLASNFRGLFIFLIARLLGEAALGRFGLAFAATELLTKAGDARVRQQHHPVPRTARAGEGPRRIDASVRAHVRDGRRGVAAAGARARAPVVAWLAIARGTTPSRTAAP